MTRTNGLLTAGLCIGAGVLALGGTGWARAADSRTETNKRVVAEFYEVGLNKKDYAAAARLIGPRYVQHNPTSDDGAKGFEKFLAYLRANYPQSHSAIRQVFADGDYVILHVHEKLRPSDRGNAIVDIYRLENGKIVEHWDVKQPIPEQAANNNGMF